MGRQGSGAQGLGTAGGVSVALGKGHQPRSFCPGWQDLVWSGESSSGEGLRKWGGSQGGMIPGTASGGGDAGLRTLPLLKSCAMTHWLCDFEKLLNFSGLPFPHG